VERFYSHLPQTAPFGLKASDAAPNAEKQQLLLAGHQALLAQYAQQFYNSQNGLMPKLFNPLQQQQHESSGHDSEKERYLASLGLYNSNMPPGSYSNGGNHFNAYQRQQATSDHVSPANGQFGQMHMLSREHQLRSAHASSKSGVGRGDNSSGSRSPSPSSSQLSGNAGCDEEDEDCGDDLDSQSIGAANGEWTYEEQFKQVGFWDGYFYLMIFRVVKSRGI